VLDILPNGSGFLRTAEGDDAYISPAQIRRCELRAGDEVAGPSRPARRNERHPSLVRVETVNGRDAEPPEDRPLFGDLTPVHPTDRLSGPSALDSVPFGKGSRVAIGGGPGAGATRLLRELVATIAEKHPDVSVSVVLVGARPEELTEWTRDSGAVVTGGSFDRSAEAQAQAAELAVERAKRGAERGGDALVVVDSLESLPGGVARRVFGAARNIEDGGSLTVVAATGMAWEPQRQASTRVSLDPPADDGTPQVSASRSAALRADLLK
jgi:transcription termination factor Rho